MNQIRLAAIAQLKKLGKPGRMHGVAASRVAVCGLIGSLLLCTCGLAETVRVTLWRCQPAGDAGLKHAASVVRQLDPDVLMLQGVQDWQSAHAIAQALRPSEYQVALCTLFPYASNGSPSSQQISVLTKQKPYFSWSESWRGKEGQRSMDGGFAFVALEGTRQRLGFYCLEMPGGERAAAATAQLLEHLRGVKSWEANAINVAIVGGNFGRSQGVPPEPLPAAVALLQDQGLADACFDLPPEQADSVKAGTDLRQRSAAYLLAERGAIGLNPQELIASGQSFLTSNIELDPIKVAAAWPKRAQELERRAVSRGDRAPPPGEATSGLSKHLQQWWWAGIPVVLSLAWALGRRRKPLPSPQQPALLPGIDGGWIGSSSYTVVISPQSTTGSAENECSASTVRQVLHLEPPSVQTHSAAGALPRTKQVTDTERKWFLAALGEWLKHQVVRRLAADRRQLLEVQQAAELKVRSVDERLARIEQQIQKQTREYEQKIEELTCELATAKGETQELIRARIAQVKLDMAAVRQKVLSQGETLGETQGRNRQNK